MSSIGKTWGKLLGKWGWDEQCAVEVAYSGLLGWLGVGEIEQILK